MHNKTLYKIESELRVLYPETRICNNISYSKTTTLFSSNQRISDNMRNAYMLYLADLNRVWLYLDLAGLQSKTKAINWFKVYTNIDFLKFQTSLNEIYEIFRREHLSCISLSRFKALVKDRTGFPATLLLAPLWSQIEDFFLTKDKSEMWPAVMRNVVQWCRTNQKLRLKLDSMTEQAYQKFVSNDNRLSALWRVPDSKRDDYCQRLHQIISKWINDDEFRIDYPHLSSGATSIKKTGRNITRKVVYSAKTGDQRLEFIKRRFNIPSAHLALHASFSLRYDIVDLRVARFLDVDKNTVETRGIGPQDPTLMWVQQGVKEWFYKNFFSTPFARKHMPIFDRTVNMNAALKASLSNRMATVDMSSASDSVATPLIARLFGPNIRYALLCAKSDRFDRGAKFTTYATMGDASTFPIETIVFGSCIKLAIDLAVAYYHERNSRPPFDPDDWSTFGDDIIVPNDPVVLRYLFDILQTIGFKVNFDKSFCYGPYRESCGVEAYLGYEIQPDYFRPRLDSKASFVASLIHICNAYYVRGYKFSRQYWLHLLSDLIGRRYIPFTENPDDGARVYTPYIDVSSLKTRYNGDIQELEVVSRVIRSPLDDTSADSYNDNYAYYIWLASNTRWDLQDKSERTKIDLRKPLVLYKDIPIAPINIRETIMPLYKDDTDPTTCYDERRVKLSLRAVPVRLLVRA